MKRSAMSVIIALALTACTAPGTESDPLPPEGAPNVLIIVTDDQRAGTLSVMPRTRHWFKEGGTQFTQAFATTPLCCPSRASILTGRYTHNHGVLTNYHPRVLETRSTLERYLQDAGYRTAIAGKYLNKMDVSIDPPFFDRWAISQSGYYNARFNVNGREGRVPHYFTDYIGNRSVEFLNEFEGDDERPWFLYLAPTAPHTPFTSEPAYSNAKVPPWNGNPAVAEVDRSDKPPFVGLKGMSLEDFREVRRRQLRTLFSVDDLVDALFEALRELDEDEDTLAFFLSDNGYLWGEHQWLRKRKPYTQSIKIPFLVRWPGHVAADATDSRLVANIDIAPTVMEAARLSGAEGMPMDGRSLLDREYRRKRLLTEYYKERFNPVWTWASVRTPTEQYVEYYARDRRRVLFREYYDLSRDPWQLENLLADGNPANDPDVTALARQLARDKRCKGKKCP